MSSCKKPARGAWKLNFEFGALSQLIPKSKQTYDVAVLPAVLACSVLPRAALWVRCSDAGSNVGVIFEEE